MGESRFTLEKRVWLEINAFVSICNLITFYKDEETSSKHKRKAYNFLTLLEFYSLNPSGGAVFHAPLEAMVLPFCYNASYPPNLNLV